PGDRRLPAGVGPDRGSDRVGGHFDAPHRPVSAVGRPTRPPHRAPGPDARRDAVAGPQPPGGDLVSTATTTVWDIAARVVDPEIPVLTIADLGILRSVEIDGDTVVCTITPTYSGCPAMRQIED